MSPALLRARWRMVDAGPSTDRRAITKAQIGPGAKIFPGSNVQEIPKLASNGRYGGDHPGASDVFGYFFAPPAARYESILLGNLLATDRESQY